MTDIWNSLSICDKISANIKNEIKLLFIFDDNYGYNALYVTGDDRVFGFGVNTYGCLGLGHNRPETEPQIITELCFKNIQQFINGWDFVLALNSRNQLYGWGCNDCGQLGKGYNILLSFFLSSYSKPEEIKYFSDIHIKQIACGSRHTLLLSASGVVYGWGANGDGQIGSGDEKERKYFAPRVIKFNAKDITIKSIHCSYCSSYALTDNGQVYSWGNNRCFQLGHDVESNEKLTAPQVLKITNIKAVSPSHNNTYFLTNDGFVYFCGLYRYDDNVDSYQSPPSKLVQGNLRFESLHSITYNQHSNAKTAGLCENRIHYIHDTELSVTKYSNYFDFYSNEYKITAKTINLNESRIAEFSQEFKNFVPIIRENYFQRTFVEISRISSGSFGSVFKVNEATAHELFAVKKVIIDNENIAKCLREVKTLERMNTHFVVRYIMSWIEDNCLYIQMDLCDECLRNILPKKLIVFGRLGDPFPDAMNSIEFYITCQIFSDIIKCVQYLHELQPPIIHRDLKPANFLIKYTDKNNQFIKLCDMGLAVTHEYSQMSHTAGAGTPKYMAPEISHSTHYTTHSDIYSLGIIGTELFEINLYDAKTLDKYLSTVYSYKIKKLNEMFLNMTQYPKPRQRFDCRTLLSKFLFINENKIKDNPNVRHILANLRANENIFFYKYLNYKLDLK